VYYFILGMICQLEGCLSKMFVNSGERCQLATSVVMEVRAALIAIVTK